MSSSASRANCQTSCIRIEPIAAIHLMNQLTWALFSLSTQASDYSAGSICNTIRVRYLKASFTQITSLAEIGLQVMHGCTVTIAALHTSLARTSVEGGLECSNWTC